MALKAIPIASQQRLKAVQATYCLPAKTIGSFASGYQVKVLKPRGNRNDVVIQLKNAHLKINGIRHSVYAEDFKQNRIFVVSSPDSILVTRLKPEYQKAPPSINVIQTNPQEYVEVIETLTLNQDGSISCQEKQLEHNGQILKRLFMRTDIERYNDKQSLKFWLGVALPVLIAVAALLFL